MLHLFLLPLLLASSIKGAEVVKLPYGVSVIHEPDTAIVTGRWNILIITDKPKCPYDIHLRFEQFVASLVDFEDVMQNVRINLIRQKLGCNRSRQRRGLINLGGDILRAVFGIATEDELATFRKALNNNAENINRLYHDRNTLVSIVNDTLDAAKENRQHIKHLENVLNKLHESQAGGHKRISVGLQLSGYKVIADAWNDMHNAYGKQREALEAGELTETLLTPINLRDIIPVLVMWIKNNGLPSERVKN